MFQNKLKLILISTALVVGSAGAALAQRGGPDGARPDRKAMKEKFDLNKDGTLDATEKAKMKEAFMAKRGEHRAKQIAQFDTNRNGTLDPAERQAMRDTRAAKRFAALDTNRDGQLSLAEFKAGKDGKHGKRGGKGGKGGRGGHGGGPGGRL